MVAPFRRASWKIGNVSTRHRFSVWAPSQCIDVHHRMTHNQGHCAQRDFVPQPNTESGGSALTCVVREPPREKREYCDPGVVAVDVAALLAALIEIWPVGIGEGVQRSGSPATSITDTAAGALSRPTAHARRGCNCAEASHSTHTHKHKHTNTNTQHNAARRTTN
jgi:hypothetical protein